MGRRIRQRFEGHRGLFAAVLIAVVFLAGGCASSAGGVDDGVQGPRTSDGALLTLDGEPSGPVWRDWSPTRDPVSAPIEFGEVVRAFDYWQIEDGAVVEEIWSALFPVLDTIRASVQSEAQRDSLQLMLEAIEPGRRAEPTRMDLTFVVSSDGSDRFEGFACRLYRRLPDKGVTPVVTVLLLRRPQGVRTPSRIAVWAAPGFEEPETVTAIFERGEKRWRRAIVGGLALPVGPERPSTRADAAGNVAAKVLTDAIWRRFAGDAYLESPQSGSISDRPNPEDVEPALGLDIRDRLIDQVYSNTTFPPRADLDDL